MLSSLRQIGRTIDVENLLNFKDHIMIYLQNSKFSIIVTSSYTPAIVVTKVRGTSSYAPKALKEPSLAIEDAIQANKYGTTPNNYRFYEQYSTSRTYILCYCLLGCTPKCGQIRNDT